ncbi:MAG: hypothetical protein WC718_12825 [Phycisphaerales bacterium]|jgi:hypothetical protein
MNVLSHPLSALNGLGAPGDSIVVRGDPAVKTVEEYRQQGQAEAKARADSIEYFNAQAAVAKARADAEAATQVAALAAEQARYEAVTRAAQAAGAASPVPYAPSAIRAGGVVVPQTTMRGSFLQQYQMPLIVGGMVLAVLMATAVVMRGRA